jgi:hypothetical protein
MINYQRRILGHIAVTRPRKSAALTGPTPLKFVQPPRGASLRRGRRFARETPGSAASPDRGRGGDNGGEREVVFGTPKAHQRRSVPIPRFLTAELAAQPGGKGPDDLVFTSPQGEVLRNTNFGPRIFDPAARRSGLDGLSPPELPHTAASLAVPAGANVNAVHAWTRICGDDSGRLCRPFGDALDAVADPLDRAFFGLNADSVRTDPKRGHNDPCCGPTGRDRPAR